MRVVAIIFLPCLGLAALRLAIALAVIVYLGLLLWALITKPAATFGLVALLATFSLAKAHPVTTLGAMLAGMAIVRITTRSGG